MAATKEEIRTWLLGAQKRKCSHVLIVCDTFDHTDYPVYVVEGVNDVIDEYRGRTMQRVIEVYDLSKDIELQLAEDRAWHCSAKNWSLPH